MERSSNVCTEVSVQGNMTHSSCSVAELRAHIMESKETVLWTFARTR